MPGIYIHVPFCDGKCPYCDFYSLRGDEELFDRYGSRLERVITQWAAESKGQPPEKRFSVKTVYFGGGTPNLLGEERLCALLERIRENFPVDPGAEITLEANPTRLEKDFFPRLRQAGFNRLSMGLQSANQEELAFLGRKHSREDAAEAVQAARMAGFDNISLDLMLGLPGGSREKLKNSIEFVAELGVEHVSAYLLKVEEGTPFAAQGVRTAKEDEAADQYLFCVEELEKRGYRQYEISNFAKPGRESRHNLGYWQGEEYLGFGPGAHSFYDGRRFFYPRDLGGFLDGSGPCPDGEGGGFEEFAMLSLRLCRGLRREDCRKRFGPAGEEAFEAALRRAKKCPPHLLRADDAQISFTPEGFLVSNALILRVVEED